MSNSDKNASTRDLLIETAGRMIAARGLRVTLRQIVADAGQSLGSVRYHFGNRDGLIKAALERASNHWQNYLSLIEYILEKESDSFKTPRGRYEILRHCVDVFFFFIRERKHRPSWSMPFIIRVLAPNSTVPCREIFIERVNEPNRLSINRLILAYCPRLSEEDVVILNLNLFATPIFHYELTFNPMRPLPYDTNIPPEQFYDKVKASMVKNAWLVLEQTRREENSGLSFLEEPSVP